MAWQVERVRPIAQRVAELEMRLNKQQWIGTVKEKENEMAIESANDTNHVHQKVKFEVYGEEMLEKKVRSSGNSGRIYLPPDWVGHKVKIIRID
jgi:putative transposon-encoded protein